MILPSKAAKSKFRLTPEVRSAIDWYISLEITSNITFLPLYTNKAEILVLKGGAGSGKSEFAAHKILDRCVHESGHRFLVCRRYKNTIRESCFKLLCERAAEYYPDETLEINKTYMSIKFPSGSEIICAGLDDTEKLKSIFEITDIWVEEASEIEEKDFHQLETRMRGKSPYYRQMILTFNPVSISHWLKKLFFDRKYPGAVTHESTYKDNRFLDDKYRAKLESFKDIDQYYYDVYCLGKWGSIFRSIFPSLILSARRALLKAPLRVGFFENGKFTECEDGIIRIYREPKAGRPYVIGADTAGEGSDRFAAQVLDNVTGEQVAVLHGNIEETEFPEQLRRLGLMYNTALIAVECNFSSYTVLELERLGYKKQYVRQSMDTFTKRYKNAYGFVTNKITRPIIITELVRIVRDSSYLINDEATIEEMLTFVRNEKLRAEAAEGAHDDLVMALAIAYAARDQQKSVDEEKLIPWSRSMWEDFDKGNAEEKAAMIKAWGKPKPR